MEFEELKEKVEKFVISHREYLERGLEEIKRAKTCYDDGFDFIEYLNNLKEKNDLSCGYVIPYVLGLTDKIDLDIPVEIRQVFSGDGGGLDIDTDLATSGKPRVKEYLEEKYGKDHVCSVGTYTEIGLASAIKDILRKENVPFKESNEFCSELNNDLSFEENMKVYEKNFPNLYKTYQKFKVKLDLVPGLCSMIRSCLAYYQKIDIKNGQKEISKLDPKNDKIAYLNSEGKVSYTNNYEVYKNGIKDVYEIETESGKKIYATSNHRFLINRSFGSDWKSYISETKYKEVKDISSRDSVLCIYLNKLILVKIKNIKLFEKNVQVYDITNNEKDLYINEPNYLVDGLVSHNCGKHAGGVLILDKPIYECLPVIRPQGELASAFVENGGNTELDELGYIKYDLLGISTLDIINDSVDMINEELYRIIDDDGIEKIVPESYLRSKS